MAEETKNLETEKRFRISVKIQPNKSKMFSPELQTNMKLNESK